MAINWTSWLRVHNVAQHYMMWPNTTSGSRGTWAYGEHIGPNMCFEFAVAVEAGKIIYKVALPRFNNYTGFTGGDTVIVDMRPDLVVGFDILGVTRWVADGFRIILAEN